MNIYRSKVFPFLTGLLWITFLFLDLTGTADSTGVKFAGICLCFGTALTGCTSLDGQFVALAQGLTVCADIFLLLLNRTPADRFIGVGLFLIVQLLYARRLHWLGQTSSVGNTARIAALIVSVFAALTFRDLLSALCLTYFANLCVNAAEAASLRNQPTLRFFSWGLLLFIGCDFCVGASNLGLLGRPAQIGMWFFYLPSQAWIVLSQDTKGVGL